MGLSFLFILKISCHVAGLSCVIVHIYRCIFVPRLMSTPIKNHPGLDECSLVIKQWYWIGTGSVLRIRRCPEVDTWIEKV